VRATFATLALGITLLTALPAGAGDTWPGWRGPTGQGRSDERGLPLTWGGKEGANILWKVPLPGADGPNHLDLNQSSPIVWKDRIFVVMAYWPRGVTPTAEYPEHHVACYAVADGRRLWDVVVPPGPWRLQDLRGGYAAPTPVTDGERVYTLFGSSVLAALDYGGRLVWRKEITPYAWDVAVGTSPVLYRDTVLVLADGTKPSQSRLIAFDTRTGDVRWEQPRPGANFNHTTPLRIDVQGGPQLVVASSSALQGLDPGNGRVLWWAAAKGDVPTPAFGGGLVYSEDGRGGPGLAVDPTGTGDVTATHVKWTTRPIPEGYSSPTIVGDYVYRMHQPGVLKCLRLATGKVVYTERLPTGVEVSASPIVTPDNLLYFAGAGKSIVVPAGPEFKIVATSDLQDGCPASPAVAGSRLFLKGARYLYCVSRPTAAADKPAWRPMLGDLVKAERAGFGGLCGVAIDRATGDVLINLSDRGFYRSTDGAQAFSRLADPQPKGRTETPGCLLFDPTGKSKTLLTALVYGAPAATSADGGSTWKRMDDRSAHVDWCAVDWTDPDRKFVLTLKHESGGLLLASHDGGRSFAEVGKGYGPGWVFGPATAVVAEARTKERPRPGLIRTTDGGRTWVPCGPYSPVGDGSAQAQPRWHDGVLYWLVEGALIATKDEGQTWTKVGDLASGRYGPVFGRAKGQMFVLTAGGIIETADGGATWSAPIPLPSELKGGGLTWLDYDPKGDVLYVMRMGSDLYKMARGKNARGPGESGGQRSGR
jgi:outer membrane protein assembly factor BamB/photosystem II stability/assembly factor-like uncharacterized protein